MTWLFIPSKFAQAWECLEKDCEPGSDTWASRLAPSVTLSGKHTRPASWRAGFKKNPWMTRLSGATYSPSTLERGMEQWIASLRASRAKTSQLPASASGWMASEAGYFSKSSTLPTIAVQWPTPVASDCGLKVTENSNQAGLIGAAYQFSRPGQILPSGNGSSKHRLGSRPRLNPIFTEWLMGWPSQWTKAEHNASSAAETESFQLRQQSLLASLLPELKGLCNDV